MQDEGRASSDGVPGPDSSAGSASVRRCVVRGRVQGVGFRWWVHRRASELGLLGWVRNRPDGSVEVVVVDDSRGARELVEKLYEGPPSARVDTVEVEDVDAGATPAPGPFEILR